jgi:hypothetical protein
LRDQITNVSGRAGSFNRKGREGIREERKADPLAEDGMVRGIRAVLACVALTISFRTHLSDFQKTDEPLAVA